MRQKLRTTLLAVLAVTILAAVPASASAATLTVTKQNGTPTLGVLWQAPSVTITTSNGSWNCANLELGTLVTQNAADPVTFGIGFGSMGSDGMNPCAPGTATITYSNFQQNGSMTMNADLTGTIGLRVTEKWTYSWGTFSCIREGSLDTEILSSGHVNFSGPMPGVSGSCPGITSTWEGTFNPPTAGEDGLPVKWVVTP